MEVASPSRRTSLTCRHPALIDARETASCSYRSIYFFSIHLAWRTGPLQHGARAHDCRSRLI